MRNIKDEEEPLKEGTRVYVNSLEVFASITHITSVVGRAIGKVYVYSVKCEDPMPGYLNSYYKANLRIPD